MTEITRVTKTYSKTASGKGYKSQPDTIETEVITRNLYNNIASKEALRYWNGFCGGTCRATYGYTYIGYKPIRISRQSPNRSMKIVEEFSFRIINE